jgi:hypothetical protein
VERLTPQPHRKLAFGSQPLAGRRRAGGDLGQQAVAQRGRRRAQRRHAGRAAHTGLQRRQRLRQRLAAVDHDRLAGDVAGLVGGQEQRRRPDLLDLASRPSGIDASIDARYSSPSSSRPSDTDVAGHDRVDGDPRGASSMQAVRRNPVARPWWRRSATAGESGDRAGDRAGQDHAAVAGPLQVGDAGLHGQHAALDVGGEDRIDVLLGHVG